MIIQQIQNKLFCFRLGLKSIIALQGISKIDREIEIKLLLLSNPDVGATVIQSLSPLELENLFIRCFKEAFSKNKVEQISNCNDIVSFMKKINFPQQIQKLFSIAVGEIGMSVTDFYASTPFEIELAYKGFIKKQEFQMNCDLATLKRSKDTYPELIHLNTNQQYSQNSQEQRISTFKTLGI